MSNKKGISMKRKLGKIKNFFKEINLVQLRQQAFEAEQRLKEGKSRLPIKDADTVLRWQRIQEKISGKK
jgi:hypothetical protein